MKQPDLTDLQQVCSIVRIHFGTDACIVGGGAPRDILSAVPVRDIDVFVHHSEVPNSADSDFARKCALVAGTLGGTAEVRPAAEEYPGIFDLCDIAREGQPLVQIVGLQVHPVDDVPRYDFDLSQVFATPSGLFGTRAAWEARAARTITYAAGWSESPAQMLRSKDRLQRLRARYVGWKFANCEVLDASAEAAMLPVALEI